MMGVDTKQKGAVLEEICVIVDDIVKGYKSEQGRIKIFKKHIWDPLNNKLLKDYSSFYHSVARRVAYKLFESIVNSTDAIEEDSVRPGQFITYKTKWIEFREKQEALRQLLKEIVNPDFFSYKPFET